MHNGALPPPPMHQPTQSFNNEGQYVGNIHVIARTEQKENFPPHDPGNKQQKPVGFAPPVSAAPVSVSSSDVFGQSAALPRQTVTRLISAPQFSSQVITREIFQPPAELVSVRPNTLRSCCSCGCCSCFSLKGTSQPLRCFCLHLGMRLT